MKLPDYSPTVADIFGVLLLYQIPKRMGLFHLYFIDNIIGKLGRQNIKGQYHKKRCGNTHIKE
jgi:hypothetical protein